MKIVKILNLFEIPIFLIILLFAQNVMAEPYPPTPPIVISPNGGEIWSGTHDITWTASTDPDGFPMTYEIEYSYDGGGTWHPLATGISETSYSWDTSAYPDSANYLIRVRAYEERKLRELYSDWDQSDSVADNEDPKDNTFTEGQVIVVAARKKPPVASFTFSPIEPVEGEVVTFNASTSYDRDGTIKSYTWDFGDGTSDAGVIVTHAYSAAGTYTVTLTVTDDDGLTDTATDDVTVAVLYPPVASFTFTPTNPTVGKTVNFNASNSYDQDGTIVSYDWDFGDGAFGKGMTTTHAYTTKGTFTATLTVTDDDALTDSTTADVRVSPSPVNDIAIIDVTVSPTTVKVGDPVSIEVTVVNSGDFSEIFNVTVHYDSVVFDTRIDVSLDAGSTKTLTFTWDTKSVATGTYTISARASVVPGEIDTADNVFINGEVTVSAEPRGGGGGGNERPRANFTYSPSTPTDMDTIEFKDNSHDPDGSIASWLWDFGDGSSSTEKNPAHQYVDNGNYIVTLTVRDNYDAYGEITKQITVLNVPPKADFTIIYKLHQQAPQGIIEFEDRSSDRDGSIVSWRWEFGDGTISTDQNPTHRYEVLSTYTIKLVVTDDDGAIDVASKIYDPIPPISINDYDGLWHTEDFTIALTATDDYSGVQAIYYKTKDGPTKNVQDDGQPHITAEGNNKLEYWSVDGAGNEEAHHIIDVKLDKTAPVANAGGDRSVAQNILVTFDASRSSDSMGIVSYEWNFGEGSGMGLTTTHTYKEPGNYVVWLTVEDAAGNKNTDSVFVTVLKDTDGDRTPDATDIDDDDDGMPDTWELSYMGLDPFDPTDAALDPDGDGLSNLEECRLGTDPIFYFSPFPPWIFVLVAAFGTIFVIIRYVIMCAHYRKLLKKMKRN